MSGCQSENKTDRPSPLRVDSAEVGQAKLKIEYSSPAVRERQIWGDLVPYYKVWRTGANEATIFETSNDILIEGKLLPKGKYALFTIPEPEKWTIIFHNEWNQWGAYNYDGTIDKEDKNDVLRLKIKPEKTSDHHERMEFNLESSKLKFQWERMYFDLNIDSATLP